MRGRSKLGALVALAFLGMGAPAAAAAPIWREIAPAESAAGPPRITARAFRLFAVEETALEALLASAPREGTAPGVVLPVPRPDGSLSHFRIQESPVMEPALAARHPSMRTFRGQGIEDPSATARFGLTRHGFHGIVLSSSGTDYLEPMYAGDDSRIAAYRKRDYDSTIGAFSCEPQPAPSASSREGTSAGGDTLRTYRLAIAANAEYTAFHGGTVEDGLAAIVTAVNRVDGVYERDLALRMILVADNDRIVYTNPNTDPYVNNNPSQMLSANQTNLDAEIGTANYDIGHVFSTGGGGLAVLRAACSSANKAKGVTGLAAPVGDPFYIDYVAHELGHQWGANHTFNGNEGSCSGNRNGATAFEPGSGSTIMAYAGICGSQDLQSHSDDYFHGISQDEILAYSTAGGGSGCALTSPTGNQAPQVDAGPPFAVPVGTPFTICGTAIDPDGDPLTYAWEEMDAGPAGSPLTPSGNAPLFRSFPPTPDPCRTFPRIADVLAGTSTIGEVLPSYGRTLKLRLTARDNRAGGGGTGFDETTITVDGASGPFRIVSPESGTLWNRGGDEVVAWNVAGTDSGVVGCAAVDILLSTDGGATFPALLAGAVPNDGTEIVPVPADASMAARVLVRCSDGTFFAVSDGDFEIGEGMAAAAGAVPDGAEVPGTQLTLSFALGDELILLWGPSCAATDDDYAVYEGALGDFGSHVPLVCSTGGLLNHVFSPPAGSHYYLVVPRNLLREGSYGHDSGGGERPVSADACTLQAVGACGP